MINREISVFIEDAIKRLANQEKWSDLDLGDVAVERPVNTEFGDYTTNIAFNLAKKLDKVPRELAEQLVQKMELKLPNEIKKVEAVGGYVNFFLSEDFLHNRLADIYKNREDYGRGGFGKSKKIIVEYSQPNIAKPMHVGHLRNTVLGDALANILEFSGYEIIRWNYIGDWGTQFGKLIAAYRLWSNEEEIKIDPVKVMVDLYIRFHGELKNHPELERRGQEEFLKLEQGDKENLKLWKWFRDESLKEFEKTYRLLDVSFDQIIGESFFEKDMDETVKDLMKDKVAEIGEENAKIIKLDEYGLPPALIQKGDGASLYLTRDIAALKYRLDKYKPEKMLYVVGNEQSLHFEQLFAVARILGWQQAELCHVKYGLVLGENKKKMSTREGEAISLADLVKKAVELARDVVEQKNSRLSEEEKQEIARTVGIGALKYEMLKEHRSSDIIFDWNKMLDLRGNSAPYLQYTYARLTGILRKVGKMGRADLATLVNPVELAVIRRLLDFPEVVAETDRTYLTNHLALYLYELSNLANQFYEVVPVSKDENELHRNANLMLIEAAAAVIKKGLGLLGIKTLDKI